MNGLKANNQKPVMIIQAGGRGSRLRHMTWNKPKCLATVDGKPILYHLFEKFPEFKFIIIGDYLIDVLDKYLKVNIPIVDYELVNANGKGTLAGVADAVSGLESDQSFYICWSDLILDNGIPGHDRNKLIIFTTNDFLCRWRILNKKLIESAGQELGIAGLFYFPNKSHLEDLPLDGEFVRWLSETQITVATQEILGVSEMGDFSVMQSRNNEFIHHRFFNDVKIFKNIVVKTAVIAKYESLNKDEISWYEYLEKLNYKYIPKIHKIDPLTMDRINGQHPFEFDDLTNREAAAIINNSIVSLTSMHNLKQVPVNQNDVFEMYVNKTINRVKEISSLLPMWSRDSISVNGKKCKNWFGEKFIDELGDNFNIKVGNFSLIHGDPTFSNTLVNRNLQCLYIDPRGSFGSSKLFGDPNYDFAKIYYSAYGNYDAFNRKKFKVYVDDHSFEVMLEEGKFKNVADSVFADHFGSKLIDIRLLHALIWASLTGYVKDDIDSIIGAYCLATLHFQEVMENGKI